MRFARILAFLALLIGSTGAAFAADKDNTLYIDLKDGRGDILATIRIMLPPQSDEEFEALMKKWRSEKPYDPRKDM